MLGGDKLEGGLGADLLIGGSGDDSFDADDEDAVVDFLPSEDDLAAFRLSLADWLIFDVVAETDGAVRDMWARYPEGRAAISARSSRTTCPLVAATVSIRSGALSPCAMSRRKVG